MRRLTLIEAYVLRQMLIGVAAATLVIASIIVLINVVELSRTIGVRAHETSAASVFGLTLLKSPSLILLLMPFCFLFGVLGAYVNLNRRGELVAMRAAGVSAWRFIFPAAAAAAVIGVVTVLVFNPIASSLNNVYERLSKSMLETFSGQDSKTIWLRQGDGRTQIIIQARARAPGPGVRLKDVTLYRYSLDRSGSQTFESRIDAAEARLEDGQWKLFNAREGRRAEEAQTYQLLTVPSTLNVRTALEPFASPQAVPFWALPGVIARTEKAGFSATGYRLQFDQLLATPLMFAAMSVVAAAFSLRLLRLGDWRGWRARAWRWASCSIS